MHSVGSRIKALRLNKEMNQLDLSNELNNIYGTSINKGMISKWENGKDDPSMKFLRNIADYFCVTLDYLIGNTENVICNECGFMYSPLSDVQIREHKHRHSYWLSARGKHGIYNDFDVNNGASFVKEELITIAAHKENNEEDWTEEELKDIEDFKKYILSKRKK